MVGDVPLLLGRPAPWDAQALVETTVVEIPASSFLAAFDRQPAATLGYMARLGRQLASTQARLEELLGGHLRSQVAALLLSETAGATTVELTQQVIADLLGVRRPSVNRVLRDLHRKGVVTLGYGYVEVVDADALATIAGGGTTRRPVDHRRPAQGDQVRSSSHRSPDRGSRPVEPLDEGPS